MKKKFSDRLDEIAAFIKSKQKKFKAIFKWLYPGIGIKRWILTSVFAVVLIVVGSGRLRFEEYELIKILDAIILVCGIVILVMSIIRMIGSFIELFMPSSKEEGYMDILVQKKNLVRGPRIVTIGGGTGLSALLSGLKEFTSNITAIVTMADDGGSSGRLRQQFDMLPPGDVRNCLVALADSPVLIRDLFQFRFDKSTELSGHSFGNLFITAMTQVTGDFDKAIKETSKVLALRGQVIPSTLDNVVLIAQYKDGSSIEGEMMIPKANKPIKRIYLKPSSPQATPEAIKAIDTAQIIVLGPGSLFTSIIPNLLIPEITKSIVSSSAIKIYVCNAMTQLGETDGFLASDHVKALRNHSHPRIIDYCVVNTGEIPQSILTRYKEERAYPVVADAEAIAKMGYRVIEDNIISTDDVIRHDPLKLARIIVGFMDEI